MKRMFTLATLTTLGLLLVSTAQAQSTAPAGAAPKAITQQPVAKPASQTAVRPAATSTRTTEVLDINTATRDQLAALPGIGQSYADAIIKARPFRSKSELVSRKIVPASAYKKFRAHVTAKQIT